MSLAVELRLAQILLLLAASCILVAWVSAFMLIGRAAEHRRRIPGFELYMLVHPFGLHRWLSRFMEVAERDDRLRPELPLARRAKGFYTIGSVFGGLALLTMLLLLRHS